MTDRVQRVTHQFVKFIPEELEEGMVYVSLEYRVVMHRCCCGCGEYVVTPLNPAQWALTYDGETVSLTPSIGGGHCNSHYFITRGKVRWARPLTEHQRVVAAEHDHAALRIGYGMSSEQDVHPSPPTEAVRNRERGLWAWIKNLLSR